MTKTPVHFIVFNQTAGYGINRDLALNLDYKENGYNDIEFDVSARTLGAYKLAHEVRLAGYTAQVIDYADTWDIHTVRKLLDKFVGEETLAVGFSTTWMNSMYTLSTSKAQADAFPSPWNGISETPTFGQNLMPQGNEFDRELVSYAKKLNPKIKIFAGGANVTSDYQHPLVDVSFAGSGDITVVEALEAVAKESHLDRYNDWQSKLPIRTSTMHWYPEDHLHWGEQVPIEISRGCIFKCKFCSFHLIGKKKGTYIRDMKLCRDEILRNYDNYGITDYFVTCDTFNDSNEKIDSWLKMAKELPFDLKFRAWIRLDLVYRNPDQVKKLAESGLKHAFCGIETLNPDSAKSIGKGLHPMKQMDFLHEIKRGDWKDVGVTGGFIIGLPHDDKKTIRDTLNFLASSNNPLDAQRVSALYIRHTGDYLSEFSKNYLDHGYIEDREAYEKASSQYHVFRTLLRSPFVLWRNKHGITMVDCINALKKWNNRMIKLKPANVVPEAVHLGFPKFNISAEEAMADFHNFYRWNSLEMQKRKEYLEYLFAIKEHSKGFHQPVKCDECGSPFDLDSGERLDNTIIPTYNIS